MTAPFNYYVNQASPRIIRPLLIIAVVIIIDLRLSKHRRVLPKLVSR